MLSGAKPREAPSLTFRVVRPEDLVALDIRCFRCALVEDDGSASPEIVADADGAWLEVRLAFQHLGELALYRVEGKVPEGPLTNAPEADEQAPQSPAGGHDDLPSGDPPTEARAANGSRLCFDVPAGERIEFTIEGVLAALSRLPLRVSPLATPQQRPRRSEIEMTGVVAELPGGTLVRSEIGPALVGVTRARRELGREQPRPAGGATPARDVLRAATALRAMRNVISVEAAVDLGGLKPSGQGAASVPANSPAASAANWRDLIGGLDPVRKPSGRAPRPPTADQTAIEAPYRLILSPSRRGGFAHALRPVHPASDPSRVELWHTRLGVRTDDPGTSQVSVDERESEQRVVRAIWARDLDPPNDGDLYAATDNATGAPEPFRMSLDGRDRGILVRQTADETIPKASPRAVDARRLYLSGLGAWLDLHVAWEATEIRARVERGDPGILAWDHVAPLGRDQYVRVVYPGYLFPFGHACALVKVTERKALDEAPPQARLYQRKFLVVGEPVRTYDQRDLPFKQVRLTPLATPDIDDPAMAKAHTVDALGLTPAQRAGAKPMDSEHLFWPAVGGEKFRFVLDCLDQAGDPVHMRAPLLFVAAHLGSPAQKQAIKTMYEADAEVPAASQQVSIAESDVRGDTAVEVESFSFGGEPGGPGSLVSRPAMATAQAILPATRRLLPEPPKLKIAYAEAFRREGFAGGNTGQVFAELVEAAEIVYRDTAQSGGLVAPNIPIEGISKLLGPVGDVASVAAGDFDPGAFLEGLGEDLLPKLFGIVNLTDLLEEIEGSLDQAPRFLTEALDVALALIADLSRLVASLQGALGQLQAKALAAETEARAALKAQVQKLEAIRDSAKTAVDTVLAEVQRLQNVAADASLDDVKAALMDPLGTIGDGLQQLEDLLDEAPLPPAARADLERLLSALKPLLAAGEKLEETIELITSMVNGLTAGDPSIRARYEWKPKLRNWPAGDPILAFDDPAKAFELAIEARASASGDAGLDALAELRGVEIRLVPAVLHILTLRFERIAFRGGSARKPEVDVLFDGVEFEGILQFVRTLSEVIPLDALSDPPYVSVDASGAKAGFDLGLPNLSVGAFSLENMSLGLEARVPFLGEAVTVGFNFCTRERPFGLTVMMFGGGGFFGLRASPKGLILLEGALEFGARVSLDFGVASGSIEAMGGVYYRQEDGVTTLSGYFRLRGEVSLLGIASVALTAELSLTYREKDGGKGEMYGQAKVTLEIELLFIERSVSFTIERRFAGAAGDPTLAEALDVSPDGESEAWSDHCLAFAG